VERLKTSIEGAANNIKLFYGVSKGLPVIGDKIRNTEEAFVATRSAIDAANESINRGVSAGDLLSRTFEKVSSGADFLVTNLAKIGFALFGLQKVVEVLQGAFGQAVRGNDRPRNPAARDPAEDTDNRGVDV